MAITTLFNGKVYLNRALRTGNQWELDLNFVDYNNKYKGTDARIGDVVYMSGVMGQPTRGVVSNIQSQNATVIKCIVSTDNPLTYIPPQHCAIVRETTNWKYPMFPNGIPEATRSKMLSYYAWLADQVTGGESGCTGDLIFRQDIVGTETMCLKLEDGTSRKIQLSELREWILTLTNSTNENYRLGVGYGGAMFNQSTK